MDSRPRLICRIGCRPPVPETGIGAAGTTIVGMAVFAERVSRMRIALIVALVAAGGGLKLVSAV
jgi:hypothetical protein